MNQISLLRSKDIYIEINGIKVAAIKDFRVTIKKENYNITSISQSNPINTLPFKTTYIIELSKISLLDIDDVTNIFNLKDFNLIIKKGNNQTIFAHCNWTSISESISINSSLIHSLSLVSTKKLDYK